VLYQRGVAFSLRAALGNQRDNSRSSTLGNRWRSAPACGYEFWQMFYKQNSLLPKQKKGCFGTQSNNGWGVGAYPNLEAAFLLPQDSKVVQPQVNPVYEAAFKRYSLLYDALKAVR